MDNESIHLLARFQDGDDEAAEAIFHRYTHRLCGLARNRISEAMQRRVDADDVVQSVYRSFFTRAQNKDAFQIERSGDLWRLLAAITVNKVRRKARFHRQEKRSIDREHSGFSSGSLSAEGLRELADGPSEPDAVAVVDELEAVMATFDERQRKMLELRLQGHSLEEISDEVGRSQRTVRRLLEVAEEALRNRLVDDESAE